MFFIFYSSKSCTEVILCYGILINDPIRTTNQTTNQFPREIMEFSEKVLQLQYRRDTCELQTPPDTSGEMKRKRWDNSMVIVTSNSHHQRHKPFRLLINGETINGHPLKAIIDPGAQTTSISLECVERCNLMSIVDSRYAEIDRGVGVQDAVGRILRMSLFFESNILSSSFTVRRDQSVDVSLGINVLGLYKCCIDLKNFVLRVGTTGTEIRFIQDVAELPKLDHKSDSSSMSTTEHGTDYRQTQPAKEIPEVPISEDACKSETQPDTTGERKRIKWDTSLIIVASKSRHQPFTLNINGRINGHSLKALVDPGAQQTSISLKCAQRCNLMTIVDSRYAEIDRGVGVQDAVGFLHEVPLLIESDSLSCSFTVRQDQSVDVVLGIDVLLLHECCIDLKKRVLRIGTSGTETIFIQDVTELLQLDHKSDSSSNSTTEHSTEHQQIQPAKEKTVYDKRCYVLPTDQFTEEDVDDLVNLGFIEEDVFVQLRKFEGDKVEAARGLLDHSLGF